MKKVVLQLDVHDDKAKQKALRAVSTLPGIDTISINIKERKLTVIGSVDPVDLVSKLRKLWRTELLTVGPAKEPEKPKVDEAAKKDETKKEESEKKEEPKKEESDKKKEASKKEDNKNEVFVHHPNYDHHYYYNEMARQYYNRAYQTQMNTHYYAQSAEENPNSCTIM